MELFGGSLGTIRLRAVSRMRKKVSSAGQEEVHEPP